MVEETPAGWTDEGLAFNLDSIIKRMHKGPYLYDVRNGWGEGVPKKQTKGTKPVDLCM